MATVETRRRVDELIRRCYAGLDTATLRVDVLRRLRTLLTVDAAFFATVDPATMLFTSAVIDAPLVDMAPLFLANELAGSDVNRFVDVAAAAVPVRSLDAATRGARADSERYTALMRPLGFGDELRAALRTGTTCWGVLCLHREDAASGFDPGEVSLVARLAPHIAEGLRRATLAAGFAAPDSPSAHGVLVVDDDGSLTSMNDRAERLLAAMSETDWPATAAAPLPILAATMAARSGTADATAVVRTTTGGWVSIHASRLHGSEAGAGGTVVVLEPARPSELASIILDAHAVTGAQARVVGLVLRGRSTQQIVNELQISSHTVQEHLKAVFDKFGVRSRRELVAALSGAAGT